MLIVSPGTESQPSNPLSRINSDFHVIYLAEEIAWYEFGRLMDSIILCKPFGVPTH